MGASEGKSFCETGKVTNTVVVGTRSFQANLDPVYRPGTQMFQTTLVLIGQDLVLKASSLKTEDQQVTGDDKQSRM